MSLKHVSKLTKFLTVAGLSVLLGALFFQLHKKQQENYSTLLDYSTENANADVISEPVPGTGDSGTGTGDGNDSGSSDDGG